MSSQSSYCSIFDRSDNDESDGEYEDIYFVSPASVPNCLDSDNPFAGQRGDDLIEHVDKHLTPKSSPVKPTATSRLSDTNNLNDVRVSRADDPLPVVSDKSKCVEESMGKRGELCEIHHKIEDCEKIGLLESSEKSPEPADDDTLEGTVRDDVTVKCYVVDENDNKHIIAGLDVSCEAEKVETTDKDVKENCINGDDNVYEGIDRVDETAVEANDHDEHKAAVKIVSSDSDDVEKYGNKEPCDAGSITMNKTKGVASTRSSGYISGSGSDTDPLVTEGKIPEEEDEQLMVVTAEDEDVNAFGEHGGYCVCLGGMAFFFCDVMH